MSSLPWPGASKPRAFSPDNRPGRPKARKVTGHPMIPVDGATDALAIKGLAGTS